MNDRSAQAMTNEAGSKLRPRGASEASEAIKLVLVFTHAASILGWP
jgi:hypothetical protein